jgi:hypothetical protein
MSGFLERLRGQGKLHKQGEFTLDVEQAGNKLARFQFRDQRDFLYHLAAGLFRLGAESLNISLQNNLLQIQVGGLRLPSELLETLAAALLDQNSPQRRLAAAAQSLLSQKLVRFDWLGRGKDQFYDYLSGTGKNWGSVELECIRLEGLPGNLAERACDELERRAVYCRRSIKVRARVLRSTSDQQRLAEYPADFYCQPGQPSQLELVVDEMLAPPKAVVTDFAWHGVCYGDFGLDASLSNVVEDERYQRVIAAIPGTYAACLEKSLSDPPRELLASLLAADKPAWASPELWQRLRLVPLFTDQRDKKWSLQSLSRLEGPIYFSGDRAPKELPEVILVETSSIMRNCLQAQFPGRCQQAGELVLRQLRRRLNQHEWRQRPQTSLELPERNWLARQNFEQSQGRWVIGIPDDWAEAGGSLTVLHQGRQLCTRRLEHPEITFVIICDLSEAQINELWDDVAEPAWKDLEPRWLHGVEEVLEAMSSDRAPEGALRTYLIEHLSRSARPQDSYFAKTLLFQDWTGRMYSLYNLLRLGPGQVLGVVEPNQEPVEDWVPLGVYLRSSGWELRLLRKVPALKVLELGYLLDDLQNARITHPDGQELLPAFGQGTINFVVRGVQLEPVKVDSAVSFQAWVCGDDLTFQIRHDNSHLGLGRYRLTPGPKSKQIIQKLTQEARQLPLPQELDNTWLEFVRQANLRDLGRTAVPCWPTLREGLVSVEQLQDWSEISWTSGAGHPDYPQQPLLINLDPIQQKTLRELIGGNWKCQDAWFAENERMQQCLRKPPWSVNFPKLLASRPNMWLRPGLEKGVIYWLFRGRLVQEETDYLPSGVAAAVECESLEDRPRQGLLEKANELILEWLSVPRPQDHQQIWNWKEWEALSPQIAEVLRRQPWIPTNLGHLSWEDLLKQPSLYRVAKLNPQLPAETLFLAEGGCPTHLLDRLTAQHSHGHSLAESDEYLNEAKRRARQRELLEEQKRLLERLAHKQRVAWGEVALSPRASKECWLVLDDRVVPIANLANGLVGCLSTEEYKLRRQGPRTLAELSQNFRRKLYLELGPLLSGRVGAGRLNQVEMDCFCEILSLEIGEQAGLRWIPCADGSLTSLLQLRLEAQEQGKLLYWPKSYAFYHGGERITPILCTPLMLDFITRFCGVRPERLATPLLHQEVRPPSFRNVAQLLSGWGQAVENRVRKGLIGLETRRAAFFEALHPAGPKPAAPQPAAGENRVQLTALRRQASQLLTGQARKEMLRVLEKAKLGRCRGLWELKGHELILSESALRPFFKEAEPPVPVTLSLLISLVSAVNAESEAFTDQMEEKFLANLTAEVVGSWATSGNAGSGEVART